MATREQLLRELDAATTAGDVELAKIIDSEISALDSGATHKAGPKSPDISWLTNFRKMEGVKRPGTDPTGVTTMLSQLLREKVTGEIAKPDELVDINEMMRAPGTRFQIGAGRPFMGAYQAASKLPLSSLPPVEPVLQAVRKAKEDAGVETDVAGTVGEVLNPISLRLTKGLKAAPRLMDRIRQGSLVGGSYAALTPTSGDEESYVNEKLGQMAMGVGFGGAIPVAMQGAKFTGNIVKDLWKYLGSPNAPDNLSKAFFADIVGEKNLPKVIEAARNAREIVPGSKPTLAEAVAHLPEGSPLIALQQKTASTPHGISALFGQRANEQQSAREAAIRSFAGTEDDLAAAIRRRKFNADQNYGPVMRQSFEPESDAALLLRDLQATRGVPQWQPSGGSGPFVGKAGALQQWGKAAADAAQQQRFADTWMPVPGMPRVSGRYSPNIERVPEAKAAADDALAIAGQRGKEADFLQSMVNRLERDGMLDMPGLDKLSARPVMSRAIEYARNQAANQGYSFPARAGDKFSGQNLHDIKLGLDDQIRIGAAKDPVTGQSALDRSQLSALENTKNSFIKWFETKSPEYGRARTQFADESVPINQRQVGQLLLEKLRSPENRETPGAFMRAVDDSLSTVKKATGQSRQQLGQVLTKEQMDSVNRVAQDLERLQMSKRPQQATNLAGGGRDIASEAIPTLPRVLSRPVVIANHVIGLLAKGKGPLERRMDEINAVRMLDPKAFADAMDMLPKQTAAMVMNSLRMQHGVGILPQVFVGAPVVGITSSK